MHNAISQPPWSQEPLTPDGAAASLTVTDVAPTIAAEYLRVWDWGLFAFMHYGKDKSNPKWVALRKVPAEKAYDSKPTPAYYESLLGKRE